MKYRVTLCREYWGHIDVEANSKAEAIEKVGNYEYEGEFVMTEIGNQSVYGANPLESDRKGG